MLSNNEFVPLMILDASIATIYHLFTLLFFFSFFNMNIYWIEEKINDFNIKKNYAEKFFSKII